TPAHESAAADDHPVEARLISAAGQINLGATRFAIGRAPDNQEMLSDAQASGHHAVIRPEGQGYVVIDRGSTNGTWVNGQRLEAEKPRVLRSGDVIRIGNTVFTYEVAANLVVPPTVVAPKAVIPPPPPSYTQPAAYYSPLPASPVGPTKDSRRY